MASPYSNVNITGYNSNPPADDGSQTEANRVKWVTIKSKLPDPLKDAIEEINTNVGAAFGKVVGGSGNTSTGINYTVQSTDQGKLVRATTPSITITTPDATGVGEPFVFRFLNDTDGDVTVDGSGSQTIDGAESATFPAGTGATFSTDGSNWFTDGQNFQRTQIAPQGYLTLIPEATDSLNPFPNSDQSAKTAVYYRPDVGNLLPIPDGTNFSVRVFAELTLTLVSNHVADTLYDVFAFDDDGTIRIATGTAWNTSTAGSGARGSGAGTTELTRLKGLIVNNVQMTVRNGATTYTVDAKCGIYLGTILIDGSAGQVTCHTSFGQTRRWGVWNAWNRRPITLQMGDATASWAYSTGTVRQSNGATGNVAKILAGLKDSPADATALQSVAFSTSAAAEAFIGVGVNDTTAFSGRRGRAKSASVAAEPYYDMVASHRVQPFLGLMNINFLESGSGTNTTTFQGGNDDMMLSVTWLG